MYKAGDDVVLTARMRRAASEPEKYKRGIVVSEWFNGVVYVLWNGIDKPICMRIDEIEHINREQEGGEELTKQAGSIVLVCGVECKVHGEKFPDGKWRDVYRFTIHGEEERMVTGLREAKRVIRERLGLTAEKEQ